MNFTFRFGFGEAAIVGIVALLAIAMLVMPDYDRPPIDTVQNGFRGTGMEQVYNPRRVAELVEINQVPEVQGLPPLITAGPKAADAYQNVQVLGDLSTVQFLRLMTAITEWVSPEQGCNYCHVSEGFQHDTLYTKRVSRWMFHMTRDINTDWAPHVQQSWKEDYAGAGVNCWTCHRGNNVPEYVWFEDPALAERPGLVGYRAGQNRPAENTLLASLPAFWPSAHLVEETVADPVPIRVQGSEALPHGNRSSTKQTELTYALMMHMSGALGVNCTYCHNSRAWSSWEQSTPQRTTAWYGLQMVQSLNHLYITPSGVALPEHRLGPLGDVSKVNCATCHQGVYKPLFGANMIDDYPSLNTPNYVARSVLEPGLADQETSEAIGARLKEIGLEALQNGAEVDTSAAPAAIPSRAAAPSPDHGTEASEADRADTAPADGDAPAAAPKDRADAGTPEPRG